jgi:hypothetical protein
MQRTAVLRLATFAMAFVHTFPARKHLVEFFARPSLEAAWEGFGAVIAIVLYLLPVRVQSRVLTTLWREHRVLLRASGVLLAVVHAVPAADHLPRFVETLTWGDAWRGFGSAVAVAWFLSPVTLQRRVVVALSRVGRRVAPGATAGGESIA